MLTDARKTDIAKPRVAFLNFSNASTITCSTNTYPITTHNLNYFRHNNTRVNGNVRIIISDYSLQLAFRQESATDIRTIKMQNHREHIRKTCALCTVVFKHTRQYKPGMTIRFMPIKHV